MNVPLGKGSDTLHVDTKEGTEQGSPVRTQGIVEAHLRKGRQLLNELAARDQDAMRGTSGLAQEGPPVTEQSIHHGGTIQLGKMANHDPSPSHETVNTSVSCATGPAENILRDIRQRFNIPSVAREKASRVTSRPSGLPTAPPHADAAMTHRSFVQSKMEHDALLDDLLNKTVRRIAFAEEKTNGEAAGKVRRVSELTPSRIIQAQDVNMASAIVHEQPQGPDENQPPPANQTQMRGITVAAMGTRASGTRACLSTSQVCLEANSEEEYFASDPVLAFLQEELQRKKTELKQYLEQG